MQTSKKDYERQIAQIERRRTRIRHIRQKIPNQLTPPSAADEHVAPRIDDHYEIGNTQNHPENILLFLQQNADDPAIRVRL